MFNIGLTGKTGLLPEVILKSLYNSHFLYICGSKSQYYKNNY